MKKILFAALLLLPAATSADYLDVIKFKLKEGCEFSEYMKIVNDFNNNWAKEYGYQSKVAMPLQSTELGHLLWMGHAKDAATFGNAWDVWRDSLSDPESQPAQLWARFQACSENIARYGYDVY